MTDMQMRQVEIKIRDKIEEALRGLKPDIACTVDVHLGITATQPDGTWVMQAIIEVKPLIWPPSPTDPRADAVLTGGTK